MQEDLPHIFVLDIHKAHTTLFTPCKEGRRRWSRSAPESRPLLSLFQSAGPLLRHKQLGIMSFDLTLMTDSASVPAGREQASKGGQANWREHSERQEKNEKKEKPR